MARRIDHKWAKKIADEVNSNSFKGRVVDHNINAKWLIGYLANKDIPVRVVNLGAGVKRITIAEHICPTCKGKGVCQ